MLTIEYNNYIVVLRWSIGVEQDKILGVTKKGKRAGQRFAKVVELCAL